VTDFVCLVGRGRQLIEPAALRFINNSSTQWQALNVLNKQLLYYTALESFIHGGQLYTNVWNHCVWSAEQLKTVTKEINGKKFRCVSSKSEHCSWGDTVWDGSRSGQKCTITNHRVLWKMVLYILVTTLPP